jgi:hypothetical protein
MKDYIIIILLIAVTVMTSRMWSQVDRWQWGNIECRQATDIAIP